MEHENYFPERLRKARMMRKLSQYDLAIVSQITPSAINNYESGDRQPNLKNLLKISSTLNVSLDYLAGRSDIFDAKKVHGELEIINENFRQLGDDERKFLIQLIEQYVKVSRDRAC